MSVRTSTAHSPTARPWTGAGYLLRASLRHDGLSMLIWIILTVFLGTAPLMLYSTVFPGVSDREELNTLITANPAISLILGPSNDLMLDAGFTSWIALGLGGFLSALCAILVVTRTTRGHEDSGLAELLDSGIVGRNARLLSGVLVAMTGTFVLGLVTAVVAGLAGGGWSMVLTAAALTVTGWLFAAVAAVSAQVASDRHTATTMAVAVLGVLYVLRGLAYATEAPSWTVWVNPLGWQMETRPTADDRWWPLALMLAVTLVLLAVAYRLESRRDFGQGAVAGRPGPATGSMRGVVGLQWRLNRMSLIAWGAASLVIGVAFGFFTLNSEEIDMSSGGVAEFLGGTAALDGLEGAEGAEVAAGQLTATFDQAMVIMLITMTGMIAAVPGVQTMVRLHTEEKADRLEPVIAAGADRYRYFLTTVATALVSTFVMHCVAGLVVAAFAGQSDTAVGFGEVSRQVLASSTATLMVVAVAVLVVGVVPKLEALAWTGVLLSFVMEILGPMLDPPEWLQVVSPYHHVPNVMDSGGSLAAVWWLLAVVAAAVVIGTLGFRRRDLAR